MKNRFFAKIFEKNIFAFLGRSRRVSRCRVFGWGKIRWFRWDMTSRSWKIANFGRCFLVDFTEKENFFHVQALDLGVFYSDSKKKIKFASIWLKNDFPKIAIFARKKFAKILKLGEKFYSASFDVESRGIASQSVEMVRKWSSGFAAAAAAAAAAVIFFFSRDVREFVLFPCAALGAARVTVARKIAVFAHAIVFWR